MFGVVYMYSFFEGRGVKCVKIEKNRVIFWLLIWYGMVLFV